MNSDTILGVMALLLMCAIFASIAGAGFVNVVDTLALAMHKYCKRRRAAIDERSMRIHSGWLSESQK